MKAIKIIFGSFLMISMGNEYIRAGFKHGMFYNPGIVAGVLLMLIIITMLFASAISKTKVPIFSWSFFKYYLFSFFAFIFIAFISLIANTPKSEYVEYNGIKISISMFDTMSKRVYPNEKERKEFILCVVEKMANTDEIVKNYRKELETGHIDVIFNKIANRELQSPVGLEECYTLAKRDWTSKLKEDMKQTVKSNFIGTEYEQMYNIDELCDCYVQEISKYPYNEVFKKEFQESEVARKIWEKCMQETKK